MMADAFAWYELMTPDPAASGAFYGKVVGWTTEPVGPTGTGDPYTIFKPADAAGGVAGMLKTPQGAKPGWIGYIHVPDVDAYVGKVQAAGGTLLKPASDVPGMLRFAVFADPQGAPFTLFTPLPPMDGSAPAGPPAIDSPGYIGWQELVSTDWEAAWAFYSGLFGWEKEHAMDMGPMGTYQIICTGTAMPMGAMMNGPQGSPAPYWNYYFMVDSTSAAIERLTGAGGKVLMGPHEVPGPMWTVQCLDPHGVMFSLVSSKA